MLSRRVSAPGDGRSLGYVYVSYSYSELEGFLLIRHQPTTTDRVHTPKQRLSSFIKITVFVNVWNIWVRAMLPLR